MRTYLLKALSLHPVYNISFLADAAASQASLSDCWYEYVSSGSGVCVKSKSLVWRRWKSIHL